MRTHAEDLKPLDTSGGTDQPTPDEAQRLRDPPRAILAILILPLPLSKALLMAVLTGVAMLKRLWARLSRQT